MHIFMAFTGRIPLLWFAAPALFAQPVCDSWIHSRPAASPALVRVQPEVHEVVCGPDAVTVRSAGLSIYQLGVLASPVNPANGIRDVTITIPRNPVPATGKHAALPSLTIGVFTNGIPIENRIGFDSYEGRNLWHYDLNAPGLATGATPMLTNLLNDGSRHSPIIGFALDGYPIYGPWGYVDGRGGLLKRMRSSYRLRNIVERSSWPDGTKLTPGQFGPTVDAANPAGMFAEDYEFVAGAGDLDRFNGRFSVTPEYPQGTYAYFLSTSDRGELAFPYLLASEFYGQPSVQPGGPVKVGEKPGLTVSASVLRAGQPVTFEFRAAATLEYVHERPMHVIVVSADLAEFDHIHPERGAGDVYRVSHTFAHVGRYRMYVEFTPPGSGPREEFLDVQVAGPTVPVSSLVVSSRAAASPGGLTAELTASPVLLAGTNETLRFRLNSTEGLEPYLGAWGHFVIIGAGLTNFIHAHPTPTGKPAPEPIGPHTHVSLPATDPPPDVIEVPVAFPSAGLYKLWAQFQVRGTVQVIPFVLKVLPGAAPVQAVSQIPRDAIRVSVSQAGFSPSRIEIPAGHPTTIAFTRDLKPNCASKVVIPDLGITKELPPGKTTLVNLPAMGQKELKFACGMGMYRGLLVVK